MGVVDSGLIELDAETVHAMLASGEAVLVDVREDEEFAAERIAGAHLVPMSDFEVETWPQFPGQTTIIMCLGGIRSAAIARKLLSSGHSWATHLKGGLNAWKDAGLPVVEDGV